MFSKEPKDGFQMCSWEMARTPEGVESVEFGCAFILFTSLVTYWAKTISSTSVFGAKTLVSPKSRYHSVSIPCQHAQTPSVKVGDHRCLSKMFKWVVDSGSLENLTGFKKMLVRKGAIIAEA